MPFVFNSVDDIREGRIYSWWTGKDYGKSEFSCYPSVATFAFKFRYTCLAWLIETFSSHPPCHTNKLFYCHYWELSVWSFRIEMTLKSIRRVRCKLNKRQTAQLFCWYICQHFCVIICDGGWDQVIQSIADRDTHSHTHSIFTSFMSTFFFSHVVVHGRRNLHACMYTTDIVGESCKRSWVYNIHMGLVAVLKLMVFVKKKVRTNTSLLLQSAFQ